MCGLMAKGDCHIKYTHLLKAGAQINLRLGRRSWPRVARRAAAAVLLAIHEAEDTLIGAAAIADTSSGRD